LNLSMIPHPPVAAPPLSPDAERRRARLVVLLATIGIAAALLAYAISPSVRHAVSRAAHSVGHVIDKDKNEHKRRGAGAGAVSLRRHTASPSRSSGAPGGPSSTTTASHAGG
jgi:hypothetical protein